MAKKFVMGLAFRTAEGYYYKKTCWKVFKQHYAKMLRVARTILYDEQESKDVVSDIFEG